MTSKTRAEIAALLDTNDQAYARLRGERQRLMNRPQEGVLRPKLPTLAENDAFDEGWKAMDAQLA